MSSQAARPRKILSCGSCRQRKVKCPRDQPACSQCVKFSLSCVYPTRKPTRRALRPRQSELLDRLSRLESIVGQAGPPLRELDQDAAAHAHGAATAAAAQAQPARETNNGAGRYISADFWANLCDEVESIRLVLDRPSDEEDDEEDEDEDEEPIDELKPHGARPVVSGLHDSPLSPSTSTLTSCILGSSLQPDIEAVAHPSLDYRVRLWAVYTHNVDPIIKILHKPTFGKQIQAAEDALLGQRPSASRNALLFAVYFAAVSTLSPEACQAQLCQRRDVLVSRYRIGTERALAAADFLNTNDLATLQALVIYVSLLRHLSRDRSSWALTSLVVRLAHAMNLHRDGKGERFTPFEAEMRRRLWHFIVVLDSRGAEDRGTDAIISRQSYNTDLATPIDDEDFGPRAVAPLTPKATGPAENVIANCAAMCARGFGWLSHPHTQASGDEKRYTSTEDQLLEQVRLLEDTFIQTASPNHPLSMYASDIARLVILKFWLVLQYPYSISMIPGRPCVSRGNILRTAISVLELSESSHVDPCFKDRFGWWAGTFVQWHPLAVALAELCLHTRGELVDKAWRVVARVFPIWRELVADAARGRLWTPIKRLMKRAKAARADALAEDRRLEVAASQTLSPPPGPDVAAAVGAAPAETVTLPMMTFPFLQDPGISASSGLTDGGLPPLLDSFTGDQPSHLFEYPPELTGMNMGQDIGLDQTMSWSPWNDFLNETLMDMSPEGSAPSSSSDAL